MTFTQGFLPVEASISEVEIWGLGGGGAKDVQDSYKNREQLFTEQRRKVIHLHQTRSIFWIVKVNLTLCSSLFAG